MEALKIIIQTMETMVDAHRRLHDLAIGKQTILVDGNIQELQSHVYREGMCVEEIQKLEQIRKQYVQKYMEHKGIHADSFTLEELIEVQADEGSRIVLTKIAKQLLAIIQEISLLNESNQKLIQASLSYIHYSIGMFAKKEPAIGYGPNARNRYSNILDAKI
ncbi:flagellar protein FlgN [Neobacillus drentensis]|uniref:flagellar protein FlgN n=1 Tax=Neobacillus drentensis TaxID=220684 RepID=UPI0030032DF5